MMKNDTELSSLTRELEALRRRLDTLGTQEQQYRHFFEKSPIMIYVTDLTGNFINVNQAGADLMGYGSPQEIIGTRLQDHFFSDEQDFQSYREKIHTKGYIREYETRLQKKDGRRLIVHLSGATRHALSMKLKGYEGFAIDITGRIEAETKIKESESRYKTILDNSLAGIYMFQEGGSFSYVNKRFLKLLGYDRPEEVLGRKFWEFIEPEDRYFVKQRGLDRENHEVDPSHYSYRMVRKDGTVIWVDMRCSHAPYMGIPAAVGNFIDITREKKAKKEIQQLSHKLIAGIEEERRSLASDLHDEFGQALTLLQLDLESLQRMLDKDAREPLKILNKIIEQIQGLADKVRNTTSRLRPDLLDHLGLIPTLSWYIEDFRRRARDVEIDFQTAGFKKRLSPEAEIVIYRIFQEGLNNVTKHSRATKVDIKLTASHPRAIFLIQDNGCGFEQDEDGMPKNGRSLGIGLLSMKERVASLDGSIQVKSVPGVGTAIRVELPMELK